MQSYNSDSSNAFVTTFNVPPKQSGQLDNLTFAVKDNIDVAGFKTSYGSKPWFNTHPPAVSHAMCVEQLLNAGASCIGKTISDELTCSLDGESHFYGTPVNPNSPDRIPGGSSSGSASAVACGLVDFAIGTDSAGSTRVPASHCGILGMRPTLHRISESGILPFAPSSSTVGVFANSLTVLEKVMAVLLASNDVAPKPISTIYVLEDAFSIADQDVNAALKGFITQVFDTRNIKISSITLSDIVGEKTNLAFWQENIFGVVQCIEIWNAVGAWIDACQPEMGPRIQDAMEHFKQLDRTSLNNALHLREKMFSRVSQFTKPGDLFCYPTVPMVAPLKGELDDPKKCTDYYTRTMSITSFAGIASLPEISIPVTKIRNAPLGLSIAAAYRQDEFLLAAAKKLFKEFI
ncbi:MAG: amidase family protein [Legionella sp.]|nr:amidase family protein [Legionella sp.]